MQQSIRPAPGQQQVVVVGRLAPARDRASILGRFAVSG